MTAAAIAAALTLGVTSAASANVGGFNGGDGTEGSPSACATILDWSCLTPTQLTTPLGSSGVGDLAFAAGATENNPDGWLMSSAGAASLDPKARIKANWSYSYADSSLAHNYLALSFDRASGNGNADIDFELNQNPEDPAHVDTNSQGTPVICRTNGDVLIAFQPQSSASTPVQVNLYRWHWNAGDQCTTPGATGAFTQLVAPSGVTLAEGAMNTSDMTNYLPVSPPSSPFAQATFGETAIDLTALANVLSPPAGCEFFHHLQLTTRSSSSTLNSSMEDFVDGGAVVVPACASPGDGGSSGGSGGSGGSGSGGGNACPTSPSVAITSPGSGTTVDSSTVVLRGTSNAPNSTLVMYDGTTAVGLAETDGAGDWTISLSRVADGRHGYTAVVRDAQACPGTSGPAVTVTVAASSASGVGSGGSGGSSGSTGDGSGSSNGVNGPGSGTSASDGAWLACTNQRTLSVADVYSWAGKARLTGFAPAGSVGKTVKIIAAWNHKIIGKATVLADNSFRVAVALPPARLRSTRRGAYLARLGTQTSAPLAFARRLYNTRIQIRFVKQKVTTTVIKKIDGKLRRMKVTKVVSAHTVTFVGSVKKPYANRRPSVVIRGSNTCANVGSGPVLAHAKVNAHGRFAVTFRIPQSLLRHRVIFLRAQTTVAAAQGKQASAGRSRLVPAYGITRGVHI